jgi:hypothetical protein
MSLSFEHSSHLVHVRLLGVGAAEFIVNDIPSGLIVEI